MPAQHLLLVASAALVGVLEFRSVPIPGGPLLVALSATVTEAATAVLTTFAAWAGKRLPTEAEWEFAARGRGGSHVQADLGAGGEAETRAWPAAHAEGG